MKRKLNPMQRWDALISGLEQDLMRISDARVLAESADLEIQDSPLKAFIQRNGGPLGVGKRAATAAAELPGNAAARRELLLSVLSSQRGPKLPENVRVTFSAGEKMSDQRVTELLKEMLRHGLIKKKP